MPGLLPNWVDGNYFKRCDIAEKTDSLALIEGGWQRLQRSVSR